jgi:hypothetical protein
MSKPLRLQVDNDRLTIDDLIALEDGNASMRFMRDFLARFVVGENGEFLPEADARVAVGALSLAQMRQAVDQFMAGVKGLQETTIPPASGGA